MSRCHRVRWRRLIAVLRGGVVFIKKDNRPERDERGATAVEYGLMVGLIALIIIGGVSYFGLAVSDLFLVPAGVFGP